MVVATASLVVAIATASQAASLKGVEASKIITSSSSSSTARWEATLISRGATTSSRRSPTTMVVALVVPLVGTVVSSSTRLGLRLHIPRRKCKLEATLESTILSSTFVRSAVQILLASQKSLRSRRQRGPMPLKPR
jgi:hypothetical protein